MAATPIVNVSFLLVMFAAAGAGGVPPLGAPLPLDPAMSAIAPETCLWYSASAGIGPADPASSNETEKLFAEPQVQRLIAEVEKQVMAAVRRAGGPNREQRVIATEAPKLVRALLTRPVAAYVEDVQVGADKSVKAEAAFVLNAGDGREEIAASIEELVALVAGKGLATTTDSAGGIQWQRVATPPQAPVVRFGWKDTYFIIAVGEATPAKIAERLSGDAPEWLTQLRAEHKIDRELRVAYLNVTGIHERVKPLVEQENPQAWPILERLGLSAVQAIHGVSGFDAVGCTSTFHVVTNGQRPGLLAFLPHEPLAADDLAIVPKDSLLAGAVRLNLGQAVNDALALASQFDPQAKDQFEQHLWELETHVGINVREELLGALGEAWVAYLPSGDLMTSWLNSGAAVRVKNADKLRGTVNKLVELAKGQLANQNAPVTIGTSTVSGNTLYSLRFTGQAVPISPSWCVTDDWLIFGLMPQSVQSAIDRKPEDGLAGAAALADSAASVGPAALFYQDTPQLARSLYPFLQIGVQMISGPLRQQGVEIDPTALPAADVIIKHLRPSVTEMRHAEDGFHITTRGTLPGGGNAVGAAPVLVALLLPAVQGARHAAREAQELNNMRQITLAALNYESVHRAMPADIYSKDGKPLLSWRVQLLPYMEQQAISQQFKLDEPWDSPHNKELLNQMPEQFASPTEPGAPGMTRIVGFKGDDTMFPGKDPVRIATITDGTSNTLLFVRGSSDAAVPWTKPADINFDEAKPLAGLAQPSGQFLAAFVDGSVRKLSLGLGPETVKALITRGGDEVIQYDALDMAPAPWLYEQESPPAVAVPR